MSWLRGHNDTPPTRTPHSRSHVQNNSEP
jgi:hypothetical protein